MSSMKSIVIFLCVVAVASCARILVVVPTASISHQVIFQRITKELVRRGHEVVSLTTDPAYPKGKAPANLTEIDFSHLYLEWKKRFVSTTCSGRKADAHITFPAFLSLMKEAAIDMLQHEDVQKMITSNEKFDLLILENCVRPLLFFTHFFKAPAVLVSSLGAFFGGYESVGAPMHPLVFPINFAQKLNNLTMWDKIKELYNQYRFYSVFNGLEEEENKAFREHFGAEVPPLSELKKNVQMLFLNVHPMWDNNRPVPPSVVYMGGIHRSPEKKLPEDLERYLNSSKHGVIYVSFGTNVQPSSMPTDKIRAMIDHLSKLPYDVMWKWDQDEMPGRTQNIKIAKWLPQPDLLRHPKIKLFITQAGLQSTDEAVSAGVPMLAIPMLGDQWFNAEMYVRHGLGLRVDLETLNIQNFGEAVDTIINDESYRHNVLRFRSLMNDQPKSPLDRVIWWMEHIIRHGSGLHLRSPAVDMPWAEFLQFEVVAVLLFGALALFILIPTLLSFAWSYVTSLRSKNKLKCN